MSAKPAGKCCQRKMTSQVLLGIRMRLKHWTLCFIYKLNLFLLMIPSVHVSLPCKCIPCNWYVLHTYYSGVLILIGTEPLQSKRIFTCLNKLTYIFKGAIIIFHLCKCSYKSTVLRTSAVIKLKLTLSKSLFQQASVNCKSDFKSEYLLRKCSVATNLVTSLNFIPICGATILCHFGQLRNYSVFTHSFQQHCDRQCCKRLWNRSGTHWSKWGTR